MSTKAQKVTQIAEGAEALKGSQAVVITDFTGLTANDMNAFRKSLFAIGASMTVIKKRLLKYVFEKEGMEFDPKQFEGQTGVVFSPKDMVETAGTVYKFAKTREMMKVLGGFEVGEKKFVPATDVVSIGKLPSKEVLLGQLVYMLGTPIRSFMVVLNEKSKKTAN